ncbi:CoA transferase [Nocardia sp. NPDC060249]|uniref:CoA transferase n=1 Tax=Nocardia sp. NPDC060249 TaxID=3347082 RepID=UPI003647399F
MDSRTDLRAPRAVVDEWIRTLTTRAVPADYPADLDCPVLAWAGSGAMALTGHDGAEPVLSPAPAYRLLRETLRALSWITGDLGDRVDLDAAVVLTGRARRAGLRRAGRRSANGTSRLLRTADGWCALTLSRPDDIDAVPAILGGVLDADPWTALEAAAARSSSDGLVQRAQLVGVPASVLITPPRNTVPWKLSRIAAPVGSRSLRGLVVVDLSSMWAGPLCARILGLAGARVIKVEGAHRPDGARAGDPRFFDWLHGGHEFRRLDFRTDAGRKALEELLDSADIVLEASRPRALAQLGLAPEDRPHRDGRIWLSLTGYGRSEPMRVAFGDDAAVAGGLVGRHEGEPVFCADAIADPLSGICAALAVAGAHRSGGGVLIDLSMQATAAAFAAAPPITHGPHSVHRHGEDWIVECGATQRHRTVAAPVALSPGDD